MASCLIFHPSPSPVGDGVADPALRTVPTIACPPSLSPAIIELGAAMRAGRLKHDGNPVLEW
jgi:hypothetical protein